MNVIVMMKSFQNRLSNNRPIGIKTIEVRSARGRADVKYQVNGIT